MRPMDGYLDARMERAVDVRKMSRPAVRGDFHWISISGSRRKERIAVIDNTMSGMSPILECSGSQKPAR